jgi:23S rRNA (guanosine2251-2'-O)-methyltransferase
MGNTPSWTYIYGKHVVDAAIEQVPHAVQYVYVAEQFSDAKLAAKLQRGGYPLRFFSAKRIPVDIPQHTNHQGVIAAIDTNKLLVSWTEFARWLPTQQGTLILLLSEIQDPHNVGAMIRSAAAFGVKAVVIVERNQAMITGAVAKVSAGTVFSVPLVRAGNLNTAIEALRDRGITVRGLVSDVSDSIYDTTWQEPSALVVGNEATGLREKTRAHCDTLVHIPMHPRCESLNAAAAVTASLAVWAGQNQ